MASIVANRYYNDPSIGQGFSNLASLFAPPDGADMAGYATAAAKKAEASRLAELFNYSKNPAYDQKTADRMGVLAGLYAPTQSYYQVDTTDATNRRGQDISANTALTANNADNVAAMERQRLIESTLEKNNAADNARAVQTTRESSLLSPVGANQTRFVPGSIASLYRVPEQQQGIVTVNQGETATLPSGKLIQGQTKPLSETEWQAQQNARLQQSGQLPDQMLIDAVLGKQAPVTTIKDGLPTFMSPGEAVRTNAQAYTPKGSEAKPQNYQTPDGTVGTAITGANGKLVDTQTGLPIPPNSRLFNTSVQGSISDTGISTNTNQTEATKIESQVKYSLNRLNAYRDLLKNNAGVAGYPGRIRGLFQDLRAGMNELAATYGDQAPEVFKSAEGIKSYIDQLAKTNGYDPAIAQAGSFALEMAYAQAKAADPGGEVNVKELERNLDEFDGGLAGNERVLAKLDVLESALKERLGTQVKTLRKPGDPLQTTEQPAAVEVWERDPATGKMRRAQ